MNKQLRLIPLYMAVAVSAVTLAGCKLSDMVDDDRTTVLQGYVADQNGPLSAGSQVEIRDGDGRSYTTRLQANGQFSLTLDWDDAHDDCLENSDPWQEVNSCEYVEWLDSPVMVRVQHNGESDTGSPYYYSVLCNVIYDDGRDQVNVNNITDSVLRKVAAPVDADDDWEIVATNYCARDFADAFNETAADLGTDFNFFNGPANGFNGLLKSFADDALDGAEPQQIQNSIGSLSAYPDTNWEVAYQGTVDGAPESAGPTNIGSLDESPLDIIGGALEDLFNDVTEEHPDIELDDVLEITSLSISANGLGEVGTEVTATLKGKLSYLLISREFNLTFNLKGVADSPQ